MKGKTKTMATFHRAKKLKIYICLFIYQMRLHTMLIHFYQQTSKLFSSYIHDFIKAEYNR